MARNVLQLLENVIILIYIATVPYFVKLTIRTFAGPKCTYALVWYSSKA